MKKATAKKKLELTTFTKEITWLAGMNHGWGNGYVLIPKGHKLHGKSYDDLNVDVHGGLTFGELITKEGAEKWELPETAIGQWCVGFDTAHYNDNMRNCDKTFVEIETENLKQQLKKL